MFITDPFIAHNLHNDGSINVGCYGSVIKIRDTRVNTLVSLFSPVVHKVWVETQTRVAKGQKGCEEAIQTRVVCCIFNVITACLCLSVV